MTTRLELIETERGNFTVIYGDRFADELQRDEALGVVAAVLFGSPTTIPPYLQTYAQWTRQAQAWNHRGWKEPVALIEMRKPAAAAVLKGTGVFEQSPRRPVPTKPVETFDQRFEREAKELFALRAPLEIRKWSGDDEWIPLFDGNLLRMVWSRPDLALHLARPSGARLNDGRTIRFRFTEAHA